MSDIIVAYEQHALAVVSVLAGSLLILARLPGVVAPGRYREWALRFPRHVWWGRGLMALVAIIAGYNLFAAASEEWQWARPVVVIGVPVAYWLVIQFGNQFLALRATAALLLLACNVMVRAADRSEAPSRLVVTVLVYVWVIAAIWIAAAPHQYRDVQAKLLASDGRCRLVAGVGVMVGVALVLLGTFVY